MRRRKKFLRSITIVTNSVRSGTFVKKRKLVQSSKSGKRLIRFGIRGRAYDCFNKKESGVPLKKGSSDATIGHNIAILENEGRPHKQAIAIAFSKAGRSKKGKNGKSKKRR